MEKLTTKKVYRAHREQKIANWALIVFVLSSLWLIICSGFSLLLIIQFLLFTLVLFFIHRKVTRSIWRELFRKKRSLARMRTRLHLERIAAMLNNSEPKDRIIKRHNNMAGIRLLQCPEFAKLSFLILIYLNTHD